MSVRVAILFLALLFAAQADTLVLRDGTRVTGRWWSADASQIHFLVNNQLQHFARSEVSTVTFGSQPAAPASPAPGARQPEQIGTLFFRNSSGELMPLERQQATERKRGAAPYWVMPSGRSTVRLKSAPELVFVVKLAKGIDPAALSLFPLATADDSRQTKTDPAGKNAPLKISLAIAKAGDATYNVTAKDLPPGEYAFSLDGSNDADCFAVDASGV